MHWLCNKQLLNNSVPDLFSVKNISCNGHLTFLNIDTYCYITLYIMKSYVDYNTRIRFRMWGYVSVDVW